MKLVGPIHIVGGLILFASGFSTTALSFLESVFPATPHVAWSPFFVAVFGPTVASWGLLFGALVDHFFAAPSIHTWRILLLSLILWAPLDTALCLAYRFYSGAVLNLIVFTVITVLLVAARRRIR